MPAKQGDTPEPANIKNENIAQDNATVGQQVGYILHQENHYYDQARSEDSSQERLEKAISKLVGGNAPQAREELESLLGETEEPGRVAYYYALALFSHLPIDAIEDKAYDTLQFARTRAARTASEWGTAFRVAYDLIWHAWDAERAGRDRQDELRKALGGLRRERQDEIRIHLDQILASAIEDGPDAVDMERLKAERLEGGRAGRAWKFFEPIPLEPVQHVPEPAKVGVVLWVRVALGGLALLLAVLVPFGGFGRGRPVLGTIATLIVIAGGVCACVFGARRDVRAERLVRQERDHGVPLRIERPISFDEEVKTAFVVDVHSMVDRRFDEARPHFRGKWIRDTRPIRERYKRHFVELYGKAQVDANGLDWLIRFHAARVARRWRRDTLFAYREELKAEPRITALAWLGVAAAVAGVPLMLRAGGGFMVAAVLLGIFTLQATWAVTSMYATYRCDRDDRARAHRMWKVELRAFRAWRTVLADKPSDDEMARWLDLDKVYLRALAIEERVDMNRDVITHTVLTEGRVRFSDVRPRRPLRRFTRAVRYVGRPWRFPDYHVLVFLLTESGVREIAYALDFTTGEHVDWRRTSFRYDALAAAVVLEDRRGRSQTFRLALVSGDRIEVRAEGVAARGEQEPSDESAVMDAQLVATGITGALHLLESVAADGREWITVQKERRRRRAQLLRDRQQPRKTNGTARSFDWSQLITP